MTDTQLNHELLRRIVWAIEKAVTDDIPQYLREHRLETNNSVIHLKGDYINDNLRNYVIANGIEMIPFKRYAWQGRLVVDKNNKITYSITTQSNLHSIPRKKGREKPHFLHSILAIENGTYEAQPEQLTLFPMESFDNKTLLDDYNNIIAGLLDPSEGYQHYVVAYQADKDELCDVTLEVLDKRFNSVDRVSLNEYIKPDFARLTSYESVEDTPSDISEKTVRDLPKLKPGIRPQLIEVEKEA